MFEKDAEEYIDNLTRDWTDGGYSFSVEELRQAILHFAEFGYNKANEWHYVKDGDLPKDEEYKWCVSYRGYYYVARYEEMFGCWTNQEHSEVMKPYAWKEIVLPKENTQKWLLKNMK